MEGSEVSESFTGKAAEKVGSIKVLLQETDVTLPDELIAHVKMPDGGVAAALDETEVIKQQWKDMERKTKERIEELKYANMLNTEKRRNNTKFDGRIGLVEYWKVSERLLDTVTVLQEELRALNQLVATIQEENREKSQYSKSQCTCDIL